VQIEQYLWQPSKNRVDEWNPSAAELLCFLAGCLPDATGLLRRLLQEDEQKPDRLRRMVELSGQCLVDAGQPSGNIRETVAKRVFEAWRSDAEDQLSWTTQAFASCEVTEQLIATLDDPNEGVRCRAVSALGELKSERAVEAICHALQGQNEKVRCRAARALGQMKSERAVEPLCQALQDRNDEVRSSAASALVELKSEHAIEPVCLLLRHRKKEVRAKAAHVLGQMKSERAIEPLCQALRDQNDEVRNSAAFALGELKSEHAIDPLGLLLQHQNEAVRIRAVHALTHLENPHSLEALLPVLLDLGHFNWSTRHLHDLANRYRIPPD
jgi:HEAT repeat protein